MGSYLSITITNKYANLLVLWLNMMPTERVRSNEVEI